MSFRKRQFSVQLEKALPGLPSSSDSASGSLRSQPISSASAPAAFEQHSDEKQRVTPCACFLGLVASIGGFMFGYVSGQISGFFHMADFERRFGTFNPTRGTFEFSAARQGTIVGLLCIGALLGSLAAGRLADALGRRLAISTAAVASCIGTAIEISSTSSWAQFALGRLTTGLAVGALSVAVPMYQSESAPPALRGVLVGSYQLLLTLGLWTAELVNLGTHALPGPAAWRIPEALGFVWALLLGGGILLLPESPRFAYRAGREDEARRTIARLAGVDPGARVVGAQVEEIRRKLEEEEGGGGAARWTGIFAGGPQRMRYRTLLGSVLMAGQQLTGANFFFYYGTTVFRASGLADGYVTQIVLGSANVVCTLAGLYVVARCGRRAALMGGAAGMSACFVAFALAGHFLLGGPEGGRTSVAGGALLVVFSCLFIAAFAATWGPLVWAVVAELYPARYRAPAMALATASNWFWNFMMSFFTRFVTDAIGYLYGLVFAGCCAALVAVVYFFLIESKDRSLEEIDTMYATRVDPRTSSRWEGGQGGRGGRVRMGRGEEGVAQGVRGLGVHG